jgi:hypothetical protein
MSICGLDLVLEDKFKGANRANFTYCSQKYCSGSKSLSLQANSKIGEKNLKATDHLYMRNLCTCCLESIIDDIMPFVITYMFSSRKNGQFPVRTTKVLSPSGREFQDEKTGEIRLYGNAKFKLLVHLEIWVGAIFPTDRAGDS